MLYWLLPLPYRVLLASALTMLGSVGLCAVIELHSVKYIIRHITDDMIG